MNRISTRFKSFPKLSKQKKEVKIVPSQVEGPPFNLYTLPPRRTGELRLGIQCFLNALAALNLSWTG